MNGSHLPAFLLSILILAAASAPGAAFAGEIPWLTAQGPAFEEAARTGKPVLVDVWAVWCVPCKTMEKTTYADPRVHEAITGFVPLKIDSDANEIFAERYRAADILPTTLFLDAEGREITRRVGLVSGDDLLAAMTAVQSGYGEYLEQVELSKDPDALRSTAHYLLQAGNGAGAADLLRRALKQMKKSGPADQEEVELRLAEAQITDGRIAPAVKVLTRLANSAASDEVRGQALAALVRAEQSRGRDGEAAQALERLQAEFPDLAAGLVTP